ncbi:acyltransferase [bacterium]|nr:acyltransferase [bacterium]MBU1993938.1 acyltransferase [bacterium]
MRCLRAKSSLKSFIKYCAIEGENILNTFSFIHKMRNKIRVDKSTFLDISKNAKIVNCSITVRGRENRLIISDKAILRNVILEIMGNNCTIEIGKKSMIGDNCYLSAKEEGIQLIIQEDCGLSRNVKVMTSDGHPIFQDKVRINPAKDIVIEKHTWIGDNVTILKGVHIGSGCVIGINSTVVKDVPPHSIAVGNPAKVVRENIEWKAEL